MWLANALGFYAWCLKFVIIFLGALQWVEPSPSVRDILKMWGQTCSSLGQGPIFWECPSTLRLYPTLKAI